MPPRPSHVRRSVVPSHVRPLRIVLYVLTVVTAAAALFLQPALQGAVQRGALAAGWLFTPLAIYGVFFLVYAADRAMLVRRGQYPAGRALFQVVFGVLFALLLLPSSIAAWDARRPEGAARLMSHRSAEVRLVTVEALGYRGVSAEHARLLAERLRDPDAQVRARAAEVMSRWSGRSAGDVEGLIQWAGAVAVTATTASP